MDVIEVKISELKPAEYNPRAMTEKEAKDLENSLTEFGMVEPIVVNSAEGRQNVIIGGHQRYEIHKKLNRETIPVVYVNIPDLKKEQELNIRLNKNLGHWDFDMLANFDEELLKMSGFESEELDKIFHNQIGEDNPPAIADEAVSEIGQIYQLGRHRLMCGDATKIEDVDKLLAGDTANVLITDPPYGVDYASKNEFLNKGDKGNRIQTDIANDNIKDYEKFFTDFLINLKGKFDNTFYVFMSGQQLHNLRKAVDNCDYKWSDYLIWVKNNHVLGMKDYNAKHEFILYGWQNTHKFFGGFQTTILEFDKPLSSDLHPTMKPVGLIAKLIKDSTLENNIVLDVFGGSGTTLIAAEQTNRTCYMMELDPKYCDVIRKRYAKLLGKEEEWQSLTKAI